MKTLEVRLAEAEATIATLTNENKSLKESEAAAKKLAVAAEISKQLSESKLPAVAVTLLSKQFADATTTDGIKEAIAGQVEYVKSLGVELKKNNGASDNGNVNESDPAKAKEALIVSFQEGFGVSREQAEGMAL